MKVGFWVGGLPPAPPLCGGLTPPRPPKVRLSVGVAGGGLGAQVGCFWRGWVGWWAIARVAGLGEVRAWGVKAGLVWLEAFWKLVQVALAIR